MKQFLVAATAFLTVASFANTFAETGKVAITRAAAEKIALTREPGKIKSGELEKEHGRLIYSFDIQTQSGIHEVNIDANSGKVVEDSVESAEAEAKEKQQETAMPK